MSTDRNLDRSVDVLVVGAGSAGAAVAQFFARAGRRVVLVDKRTRGETGARWVNAVPTWCFDEAGVDRPRGEETPLGERRHSFHLLGPARRWGVAMREVPMLHVDMRKLVARLLDGALAAGATLEHARLESVELHGGRVRSATFVGAKRFTVRARLVVDASGLGAAVRTRVGALSRRCPEVGAVDLCAAAEFQHEVRHPERLRALLARHGAMPGDAIAFSGIAGGYSTLTLFTHPELHEVGILTGSIPGMGLRPGLELYEEMVARTSWLGPKRFGGAGAIPLRRAYSTLGAHGIALVGDAACQVYASHGSGVGMGLLGARALADAARGEEDPGSDRVLDRYADAYHRAHGGILAASDAFRRFLQGAAPGDMDAILRAELLDEDIARAGLVQRPTRPSSRFAMLAPFKALAARAAAARFLPLAVRSLVLDRVCALTPIHDRVAEPLIGPVPRTARGSEWTLPEME